MLRSGRARRLPPIRPPGKGWVAPSLTTTCPRPRRSSRAAQVAGVDTILPALADRLHRHDLVVREAQLGIRAGDCVLVRGLPVADHLACTETRIGPHEPGATRTAQPLGCTFEHLGGES